MIKVHWSLILPALGREAMATNGEIERGLRGRHVHPWYIEKTYRMVWDICNIRTDARKDVVHSVRPSALTTESAIKVMNNISQKIINIQTSSYVGVLRVGEGNTLCIRAF